LRRAERLFAVHFITGARGRDLPAESIARPDCMGRVGKWYGYRRNVSDGVPADDKKAMIFLDGEIK